MTIEYQKTTHIPAPSIRTTLNFEYVHLSTAGMPFEKVHVAGHSLDIAGAFAAVIIINLIYK